MEPLLHAALKADLARFDRAFRKAGAIRITQDGFAYVDETKVPADLVRAYRRLIEVAYVNGWVSADAPQE